VDREPSGGGERGARVSARHLGVYAVNVGVPTGLEWNVSAHVQFPLHAARLLREHGHQVELLVTRASDSYTMPAATPEDVEIHILRDVRRRGEIGTQEQSGHSAHRVLSHTKDLLALVERRKFELLHIFGHARAAAYFGYLRRWTFPVPVVFSLMGPLVPGRVRTVGYAGVDAFTAPCRLLQESVERCGLTADLVPYSAVRHLSSEDTVVTHRKRNRVLFWREATVDNGVDLCMDAFRHVAERFPEVRFTFALRPVANEVRGLDDLAKEVSNVEVHRFPYAPGLGLPDLLSESLFACLPLRTQSAHPQLSILETLQEGVPVVCLDVGDMHEIVQDGLTGVVLDETSPQALAKAIERLLRTPQLTAEMGAAARRSSAHSNWDHFAERMAAVYESSVLPQRA
jgi:glycosyltransferase involved in cell wall biosynthesis